MVGEAGVQAKSTTNNLQQIAIIDGELDEKEELAHSCGIEQENDKDAIFIKSYVIFNDKQQKVILTIIYMCVSSRSSPYADDIVRASRLLDNEIRILKEELQRTNLDLDSLKEKIKENQEKIKLNKQLPYLVGNIVEL
ncbi:Proteasome endopeptidase complex [Forsythia ovata]|uniref:Proteasome endopeptidase complex n=1 Tax=Forsythia ovata TaxID=205694 RepID=A0ABD1UX66_9LAMI